MCRLLLNSAKKLLFAEFYCNFALENIFPSHTVSIYSIKGNETDTDLHLRP